MKKQVMIELSEWKGLFTYNNVLGLADIDNTSINEQVQATKYYFPTRSKKIGMMWITSGECTIQMGDMPYVLSKNDFIFLPSGEPMCMSSVSNEFRSKVMITEKIFMDECITNKQILSFLNCLFVKRTLKNQLDHEEINLLNTNFDNLKERINVSSHSYYSELIPVNFVSFLLDVTHILKSKKESDVSHQSTRKEALFNKFLDLLLENYKVQHEVAFYADKLFITPQYLTLIIKELTGKTTNKWIDDTLILEARKLLKTTQTTVQQIADYLNFSDQSTFGKFFKKYQGISPAEYRKMHFNSLSIA